MKIQQNSGFIDFNVNRKKYESYKTKSGRNNYLFKQLTDRLNSCSPKQVGGLAIRRVYITSNDFWGQVDTLRDIPCIGFRGELDLLESSETITFRVFGIEVISLALEDDAEMFPKIEEDGFLIETGSVVRC
jgi:hypothetical protein